MVAPDLLVVLGQGEGGLLGGGEQGERGFLEAEPEVEVEVDETISMGDAGLVDEDGDF